MCLATDTPKRNRIQEKKNTLKGVDEEVSLVDEEVSLHGFFTNLSRAMTLKRVPYRVFLSHICIVWNNHKNIFKNLTLSVISRKSP